MPPKAPPAPDFRMLDIKSLNERQFAVHIRNMQLPSWYLMAREAAALKAAAPEAAAPTSPLEVPDKFRMVDFKNVDARMAMEHIRISLTCSGRARRTRCGEAPQRVVHVPRLPP